MGRRGQGTVNRQSILLRSASEDKGRMMRPIAAAILLAFAACPRPSHAQTFSSDRISADLSFLADDLLEGRATGTHGYDLAARYVAAQFQAMGLKPGGRDGWYQSVPFVTATFDRERPSALTLNGVRFANGGHVIVAPTVAAASIAESAPAVFVGYGLESQAYGLDDYRGLDVRGKVVVYLWGTPEGLPGEVAASLQDKKAELAVSKGAVGAVTIATPAMIELFHWDKIVEQSTLPRLRWVHPDGRVQDPTGSLKLTAIVDPTAADELFKGTPLAGKLAALFADRKARPKGFPLGARINIERFSRIERMSSVNVLGLLEGSDPALAHEVVMLSAHLDHLGTMMADGGDSIANGALDNAAGVATMLEAARAFAQTGKRPRRSILFVALTAEENGLHGSGYLAKYPAQPRKLVANVNLDMPILTYDFTDVIALGAEHSNIGEAVGRAVATMGITLSPDPEPEQNHFTRSDHYSFVKEGVPAISLRLGWANGGKAATRTFLDEHYHDVTDDLTQPISWMAAVRFAGLNYLIALDLADAPAAPHWYQEDFFGDKFAPGQPRAPRPR
jgi:hypothetical protein